MSRVTSGVEVKLVKLKLESQNFGLLYAIPTITTKENNYMRLRNYRVLWMVRELFVLFLRHFGGNIALAPLLNSQYHPCRGSSFNFGGLPMRAVLQIKPWPRLLQDRSSLGNGWQGRKNKVQGERTAPSNPPPSSHPKSMSLPQIKGVSPQTRMAGAVAFHKP